MHWNRSAILIAALLAWGQGVASARQVWNVVLPPQLDARIRKEISALAAREHATLHYGQSPDAAAAALSIQLNDSEGLATWIPEMDREGYQLVAHYSPGRGPAEIRINAKSAAGFHHALLRVAELLRQNSGTLSEVIGALLPAPHRAKVDAAGTTITIEDFPAFPERGIVEGFYGKPWSHQDRLDMLRFEGERGMNVYYYAPKDDPYHRHLWRRPYPRRDAARLGELVKAAHANFVDFCFAISPGLSIRYSSREDFRQLTAKLASVSALGVSCFALFLDDVPPELQDEADRAQFKTLARAHASLINKLYDDLKSRSPQNRLVVTPTTYTTTWGKRDYIEELGALVRREIPMVWTGVDTFSPEITRAEAIEWGKLIQRPPLVWDNFPVNDADSWRPHLGPLVGRAPDLAEATQGFFSNPMVQPRASMLPLATVADYLWNPAAYDPAKSLTRAVRDQYGDDGKELLKPFIQTYGDYRWNDNLFEPVFYSRRYPMDTVAMQARLDELDRSLQSMARLPKFQALAAELAPFLPRTRRRFEEVLANPAFERLPDGRLAPIHGYDGLEAAWLPNLPTLDGDFDKWDSGRILTLDQKAQLMRGANRWRGADRFSARAALRWDREYLYLGVDVTDPDLYQPATGRGIDEGDVVILSLQAAFRKNRNGTVATGDEFRFYFSPGNFAGVGPSLFSNEDYLPPRNRPHNHAQAIRTAWRKTPKGYSGDIAIPASYFDGGKLEAGYEIGLGIAVQDIVRTPRKGKRAARYEKVVLISKRNSLFPVYLSNPSSYPRLVLVK